MMSKMYKLKQFDINWKTHINQERRGMPIWRFWSDISLH